MSLPASIACSAPTRIDLAGGTLDIWPLYHLLGNPPTLNAAINLFATVVIKPLKGRTIIVSSRDLNLKARFASIDSFPEGHPFDLIFKTIQFYRPTMGMEVETSCCAPARSGIGGSSALSIALHGALNYLTRSGFARYQLIEIAKNIETQIIKVPTGWQDFFAALYGGVQAIQPGMDRMKSVPILLNLKELTDRFVLCFTGEPRQSGINNWDIFKKALDGHRIVRQKLERIVEVTLEMEQQLRKSRLNTIPKLLNEEWKARKALAPRISTPAMDRMVAAAKRKGALAAKVCGAGGGGCIAFFVSPKSKKQVGEELIKQGGRVLNFRFVKRGLVVKKLNQGTIKSFP